MIKKIVFISAIIILISIEAIAEVRLLHNPVRQELLPKAGELIELDVLIPDIKRIDLDVKLRASIDGKLFTTSLEGYLDEFDRPHYKATIPAPLHSLSYDFVLNYKGLSIVTQRYVVTRECIYDTKLLKEEDFSGWSDLERMRYFVRANTELNEDIRILNRAVEELREIEKILGHGKRD